MHVPYTVAVTVVERRNNGRMEINLNLTGFGLIWILLVGRLKHKEEGAKQGRRKRKQHNTQDTKEEMGNVHFTWL